MIFYKILKFHDISITGKATIIFQGFPGAVATLLVEHTTIFVPTYVPKMNVSYNCFLTLYDTMSLIWITFDLYMVNIYHHTKSSLLATSFKRYETYTYTALSRILLQTMHPMGGNKLSVLNGTDPDPNFLVLFYNLT